jgi:hypothetical protein
MPGRRLALPEKHRFRFLRVFRIQPAGAYDVQGLELRRRGAL